MLKVKDVDYLNNYRLALLFSDGVRKEVDLEPYLNGEVFEPLRDINLFVQYGLTPTTIEWANWAKANWANCFFLCFKEVSNYKYNIYNNK